MSLERLDPGVLIEIMDPMMQCRKIAIVDDTGLGFFDLIGPDELPHPIHAEMAPQVLGDFQSWMHKLPAELEPYFISAWDKLLLQGLNILEVARGLNYAVQTHDFDEALLLSIAAAETNKIRQTRTLLARALMGS
jgi:hypothetical protein